VHRRLIGAAGRRNAGEMVEHDRILQRQELVGVFDDVGAVRIELHVPAVLMRTRRRLGVEMRHVAAAFGAHHAQAPHAKPGQPGKFTGRRVVAHQRDAAQPVRMLGQHVG
jgi:hypothetical protein